MGRLLRKDCSALPLAVGASSRSADAPVTRRAPDAWRGSGRNRTRWDGGDLSSALSLRAVVRRASWPLPASVAAGLLAGLLLIPFDWLIAGIVEDSLVGEVAVTALTTPLAWILILLFLRASLLASGEVIAGSASTRATRSLRHALFGAAMRHRPDWTFARASGSLAASVVDQVSSLDGYVARYVPASIQASVLPLIYVAAVCWVDKVAGVLLLLTAPLIPVFMALVGWGAQAAQERHQHAFQRLSGLFADRLRGLSTLQLLGRANDEADRLQRAGEDLSTRTAEVLRIAFLSSAVLEFFAALGVAGVALYVGLTYLGFLHLGPPLSLQAGLFCLLLAPEVYQPLRQLALHHHDRAAAKAATEMLAKTFGPISHDIVQELSAVDVVAARGPATLSLAGLTVRSPGGDRAVLRNVELVVGPGDHVAVIGASGSGKSTLIETIAGLRTYGGDLRVDGRRLSQISDGLLRERMAVLGQRPHLFQGTVAENVRFGWSKASDATVQAAAFRAGVTRFTDLLPEGLDAPLGEGGIGCSGGEAQRIALARIYLRHPGLVLLDEPTAHLDPDTEAFVLDGLLDFASGRTLIVATHSPAVLNRMHRVFRVENGSLLPVLHRGPIERSHRVGSVR